MRSQPPAGNAGLPAGGVDSLDRRENKSSGGTSDRGTPHKEQKRPLEKHTDSTPAASNSKVAPCFSLETRRGADAVCPVSGV